MALISEYFDKLEMHKKEYGENTIVLMQVGAFYEVYGNDKITDIYKFAEICDLIVGTKINSVKMSGFRDFMLEKYIKRLNNNSFVVVVYAQDENKIGTKRSLLGIYSPGTLFEEKQEILSNNTVCIWIYTSFSIILKKEMMYIGLSVINIYNGFVSVYETEDELVYMPTTFNEIERWMSIYNPSEIIIVSMLERDNIDKIIQLGNIRGKIIHIDNEETIKIKNCENQVYQKCILDKFYEDKSEMIMSELINTMSIQSLCYLLNFMNDHNPNLIKKLEIPLIENNIKRVRLENYSLRQLNIIEEDGKYGLLRMIMDECNTNMGKREMEYILLHPITNVKELNESYDTIERIMMYNNNLIVEKILKKCKDLSKIQRQIMMNKITLREINNINEEFKRGIILDKYCCGVIEMNKELIDKFMDYFKETFKEEEDGQIYFNNINEKTKKLYEYDEINDECVKYVSDKMKKYETEYNKKGKIVGDYLKLSENGYIISTENRCKILKEKLKNEGIRVIKLSSTESYIETDELMKRYEKICETREKKKCIMEELINECREKIKNEYYESIKYLCKYLIKIDIYYTKTKIAIKYGYCKPKIKENNNSFIECKKLRHPLIEKINEKNIYIANDLDLSSNGILLYGTNAVGKTSFIKSIGIGIIMAQCGFYVSAEEFIYSPYNSIFTRITGNDNIFKGLSTFAVEMSELRTILKMADKNSLILGDELCSGTEIMSATSIFVVGIEELVIKESSFIFATHLHEIVNYDEIIKLSEKIRIKHMSVIYNKEKDELIYDRRIKDGCGTKMYGLEVCKAMHLPDSFLEKANKIRLKYYTDDEKTGILELKSSQYNKKVLRGLVCEKCGKKRGEEIHHIIPQKNANKNGLIKKNGILINKNHLSNLMNICSECHKNEHKSTKS
uniref:DNA mismatch repair proteins mutS family domain-containing protein n=1 Tax=viral metagenome TaxID=1070528 RepID=A0A6C0H5D5_9ZZZZ